MAKLLIPIKLLKELYQLLASKNQDFFEIFFNFTERWLKDIQQNGSYIIDSRLLSIWINSARENMRKDIYDRTTHYVNPPRLDDDLNQKTSVRKLHV